MKCKICDSGSNNFVALNPDTVELDEVEIAVNRQGMLRARHYPAERDGWDAQDIVNIKFCPMCGRKF